MKQIYRTPSDLKGIPNGMWKSYALALMKRGPIEADLETGAVSLVSEFPSWYRDGVLYGGKDGHRLSDDEIRALQAGQLRTDDVLVPTEVIDPIKKVSAPQPTPAPKAPSHVHSVLRGMVGRAALEQAYHQAMRGQRVEDMQNAASRMSSEQVEKLVRGGR